MNLLTTNKDLERWQIETHCIEVSKMNKQELFEKALNKLDKWSFPESYLLYDVVAGRFVSRDSVKALPTWLKLICTREEFEAAKAKPKIYTQEMNDNGQLPEVGMMFIDSELNNNPVKCLVVHSQKAVYEHGGDYLAAELHECEPVSVKTDKEKAIDEMLSSVESYNENEYAKHLLSKAYDKWVGNENN